MINLLPDIEKKNVEKEYKLRRAAVALAAILGIVVTVLVLMIPLYVLTKYKIGEAKAKINAAALVAAENSESLNAQIREARTLTKVLKPQAPKTPMSGIAQLLIRHKVGGISITRISYSFNAENNIVVSVIGLAKNRKALSAFTDALSKEQGVISVDVPVSNFAKDANINYSFTLTVNNK